MKLPSAHVVRACRATGLAAVALGCGFVTWSGRAQEPTGAGAQPGHVDVDLRPTSQPVAPEQRIENASFAGWTYRSVRSANPRDGVPWELIATPREPLPKGWNRGREQEGAGLGPVAGVQGDIIVRGGRRAKYPLPVVEIPEILWKQWMPADMRDVVGIHFHEATGSELARILFTLHQVPPEERGRPGAGEKTPVRGTRIEATLLMPVTFSLDQSIAVRVDERQKGPAVEGRARHEIGHAEVSQRIFFAALAGPQDWKPDYCTGRRSKIDYYWRRDEVGRTWEGYRGGTGEMVSLRTTVVLVPPTRWSMMLPVPPERVTQKQIQDFNDAIVHVSQIFAATDQEAQKRFHAQHGEFEAGRP